MIWDGRQWIKANAVSGSNLGLHFGLPARCLIGSTLGYPPLFYIQIYRYTPLIQRKENLNF